MEDRTTIAFAGLPDFIERDSTASPRHRFKCVRQVFMLAILAAGQKQAWGLRISYRDSPLPAPIRDGSESRLGNTSQPADLKCHSGFSQPDRVLANSRHRAASPHSEGTARKAGLHLRSGTRCFGPEVYDEARSVLLPPPICARAL
jgi:hypothetical protein